MRLTEFLGLFFPSDTEPIYIFGLDPKDLPESVKSHGDRIQLTREQLAQDQALQERLRAINGHRGLYFNVNAGGTKKDEINRFNAWFCEIDDKSFAEQHDLFDNCPLPPSIRIETKKSVHAYWLIGEEVGRDDWISVQLGLIDYFKSDKAIKTPNRTMRLPLFKHVSFDIATGEFLYKTVNFHTVREIRFGLTEMQAAFPTLPDEHPVYHARPVYDREYTNDYEILFERMRDAVRALPSYHREHGGKLASAQGICHGGDSNRTLVENLQTGVIFCRKRCNWEEILFALGLEKPQRREYRQAEQRYNIPRVSAPRQTSELYNWMQRNREAASARR